jgi:hypothetical protein
MTPKRQIKHGNELPFDESDYWWADVGTKPKRPTDWAHSAARGIIAALKDRQGIKHELEHYRIDEDTRREIVEEIAAIIRAAAPANK